MFQLVSPASPAAAVVADAAASENRPCANVSQFKPFISGKKFREHSNTATIANRDACIHAHTRVTNSLPFIIPDCLNLENFKKKSEKNRKPIAESLLSILYPYVQPSLL